MSDYTMPLSLRFGKIFLDFCLEKDISGEKAEEVFKQAIGRLADNLGLEIRVEKKRPDGIEVILSSEELKNSRAREPMIVV